jgi:hypothetical protein
MPELKTPHGPFTQSEIYGLYGYQKKQKKEKEKIAEAYG